MKRSSQASARTPLHHWHAARRARFVDRDGWHIAASYSEVAREVAAVRSGLGLVDISAFAKISFRGSGVPALAQALVGDDQAVGPQHVAWFEVEGRALLCRLTLDHLLVLAFTTDGVPLHNRLASLKQSLVECDVSSAYALFALLGTSTEKVLRHLSPLDLGISAFPAGSCAESSLAGVHALLIRPPETGLDMVLIAVAWDLGEYVWEELLNTGRRHGLVPVGADAWQVLVTPEG
jgi:heterotetrameric sarcosine oxidase gamma subunit